MRNPVKEPVVTAERIIVGHCPNPECGPGGGAPIAVLNNHETWPLVTCKCGWAGDTTQLVNRVRFDRGWRVSDAHGGERELRPGGDEIDDVPFSGEAEMSPPKQEYVLMIVRVPRSL